MFVFYYMNEKRTGFKKFYFDGFIHGCYVDCFTRVATLGKKQGLPIANVWQGKPSFIISGIDDIIG